MRWISLFLNLLFRRNYQSESLCSEDSLHEKYKELIGQDLAQRDRFIPGSAVGPQDFRRKSAGFSADSSEKVADKTSVCKCVSGVYGCPAMIDLTLDPAAPPSGPTGPPRPANRRSATTRAGDACFTTTRWAQAPLPRLRPSASVVRRRAGDLEIELSAPAAVGLPFGFLARWLLVWLHTAVIRQRSSWVSLGRSVGELIDSLGLVATGGPRGSRRRVREQLTRLASTSVRLSVATEPSVHYPLFLQAALWRDSPTDPGERRLAGGWLVLSPEHTAEVLHHAVPLDADALRALRPSSLAFDLYAWLSWRLSFLEQPALVPWSELWTALGADFRRPRDFERRVLRRLEDVRQVYPAAQVWPLPAGLLLLPSPPQVPRLDQASSRASVSQAITRSTSSAPRPTTSSMKCSVSARSDS